VPKINCLIINSLQGLEATEDSLNGKNLLISAKKRVKLPGRAVISAKGLLFS
jgi:hypothetical protein